MRPSLTEVTSGSNQMYPSPQPAPRSVYLLNRIDASHRTWSRRYERHMGPSGRVAHRACEPTRIQRLRRLTRFSTGMTHYDDPLRTCSKTPHSMKFYGRIHLSPRTKRHLSLQADHLAPAPRHRERKKRKISLSAISRWWMESLSTMG